MKTVRIGLVGCGSVGTAFCRLVEEKADLLRTRDNLDLKITAIGVADPDKKREKCVPKDCIKKGWRHVTESKDVDVVVELIGGAGEARNALFDALERGRSTVTANKVLLASEGARLTELATRKKCSLGFEATVGCGIPVIGSVAETLSANHFQSIVGIVNGTTNFILSRMTNHGHSYDEALSLAQQRGFAEADPGFDVEGKDAAQKLSILAGLAFGVEVPDSEIYTEGIINIKASDMRLLAGFGYVVKLLAIGHRTSYGVELRVHPALISSRHPLASVGDEFNALFLTGDVTGEVMLYGKGAGPIPTAGAVLSDVVRLSRCDGTLWNDRRWAYNKVEHMPMGDIQTGYYMIFPVVNSPGVIGRIASTLGSYGINIASADAHLAQSEQEHGIVQIISLSARERDVRAALDAVKNLPVLADNPRFYRIEVPNPR